MKYKKHSQPMDWSKKKKIIHRPKKKKTFLHGQWAVIFYNPLPTPMVPPLGARWSRNGLEDLVFVKFLPRWQKGRSFKDKRCPSWAVCPFTPGPRAVAIPQEKKSFLQCVSGKLNYAYFAFQFLLLAQHGCIWVVQSTTVFVSVFLGGETYRFTDKISYWGKIQWKIEKM